MGFFDIILDDFRFVKNKELSQLIIKLSSKELKELNDPKIYFLNKIFEPCVVIDIKNIQYIRVYLPFYEGKLFDLKGYVVTDVFFPKVKTLDDLLKAFTSNEQQKFSIQKISSFYYANVTNTTPFQFAPTFIINAVADKYIHPTKGERLFNIKTQMFGENKIYLAYQRVNDFEKADIIDIIDCPHPEFRGTINIDISSHNKKSTIFKHHFYHSKKRNNKKYERLE